MPISRTSSKREWVDHMRNTHGLDMENDTKDVIIAKASELEGVDYSAHESAVPRSITKEHAAIRKEERIKIRIPSNETDEGKSDVFVGVNGVLFQIKRDEDVEVPKAVYNVLNDAVQTLYRSGDNGELIPRQVHRYPFSVVA